MRWWSSRVSDHNAYVAQEAKLQVADNRRFMIFDRARASYKKLPLVNGSFSLTLEPAGAAILLYAR